MGDPAPNRYIAIDGPPGSGVTALARALVDVTSTKLVVDPAPNCPFLPDFAKDPQRFAFQTQVYCLLTRYRQQCELNQLELFAPSGAVADYSFARDALFARITLRPEEYGLYQRIHELLGAHIPTPDLFVYLTADREVLRARVRKVATGDRIIKLSVLDELAVAMDEYAFSYEGGPMLVINTSEFDAVEHPQQLEEFIDVIQKTRAGSNHYRPIR